MAHGASLKAHNPSNNSSSNSKAGVGSRRIFAPNFKLRVLDSYRNDPDCKGNQRATARKYGIHRRQIQKWLQVESALRNAVKKDGCIEPAEGARERDAKESIEAALDGENRRQRGDDEDRRVPALTTDSVADVCALRGEAAGGPLDLSFKRPAEMSMSMSLSMTNAAPAPAIGPVSSWPVQDGNLDGAGRIQVSKSLRDSPVPQPPPHQDIWDLSFKTRKRRRTPSPGPEQPSKSVKLFKPYLLDDIDITKLNNNNNNNNKEMDDREGRGEKDPVAYGENDKERDGDCSSVCCSAVCSYYNGVCDIKSEYCGSYSLHELQPSYYYYYHHHPSYRGEFDCYEDGLRKNGADCTGCCYEDISYGQNGLKHRQSYSLDFKLSAIDCYYQDSVCKGNQRAVANKYNIHRRQVQKWLKQAEELRLKNESLKQIHAA
ncbi:unnamed protein product [Phyllotreta striolata]|uniref:Brinker DNA-binding domain-containing protein n=1 Tax=Phyllotreta striolata TaxID=444603 RepID=A0A9N9XNZ8_PHYSR|nr:unnamed protein product [Phyllotreta striolata]